MMVENTNKKSKVEKILILFLFAPIVSYVSSGVTD